MSPGRKSPAWLPSGYLSGSSQQGAEGSERPKFGYLLETEKQYLHFKAISPGNQIFSFGIRPRATKSRLADLIRHPYSACLGEEVSED